jgi:chromosome segregation ATPase
VLLLRFRENALERLEAEHLELQAQLVQAISSNDEYVSALGMVEQERNEALGRYETLDGVLKEVMEAIENSEEGVSESCYFLIKIDRILGC